MRSAAFAVALTLALAGSSGSASAQDGGGGAVTTVIQRNPGGGVPITGPAQRPDTPAVPGTGVILGRVFEADTNSPVAGATVTLGGGPPAPGVAASPLPQAPRQVLTTGQGYFVFRDLAPGSYTASAQAGGYLNSSAGQRLPGGPGRAIDLADGQRVTDAVVRLWKPAVLTGRVLDEVGEPVIGVQVRSVRREPSGRLTPGTTSSTDDRGIYRIAGLVPGGSGVVVPSSTGTVPPSVAGLTAATSPALMTQLLQDGISSALSSGGISAGEFRLTSGPALSATHADGRVVAYPTTYYPSATSVTSAVFLRLTSGTERAGVDLQIRPVTMVRVEGVVQGPEGPMATLGLRLVPASADSFSTDSGLDVATTFTGPDGRFTFLGVPPGRYEVRALRIPRVTASQTATTIAMEGLVVSFGGTAGPSAAPADPTLWAASPVEVGQRDVTGVVVSLAHGARVRGYVEFVGAAVPPRDRMPQLAVGLVSSADRQQSSPSPVGVDQDLRFTTAGYPGGRYLVNVTGVPTGWTITEARVGDVNALVDPVTLDGRDVGDVRVTVVNGTSRVVGSVRVTGGRDPEAQVIAFPVDFASWIEGGMSNRRTRTVAARADGGYEMSGLIPGEYAFVAVRATQAIDTRTPSVIEALAKISTRATVAVGQTTGPTLSVATAQ